MRTPQINEDVVLWLESCVDTTPRKKDTNEELRWKGAQREVLDIARNLHEAQKAGKPTDLAKGFKRKSDD